MQSGLIERVIEDQLHYFKAKPPGILREINISRALKSNQVVAITGIRRCGKSTLLRQIAAKYSEYYYLNFDDDRLLGFTVSDFENLMMAWKKLSKAGVIVLDEIQVVPGWERFVRRIHDENYKVFITGSNADLLSGELSSHLTGRHHSIELYPFSLYEFLKFRNFDSTIKTTDNHIRLTELTDEYLENGGFPEYLIYQDPEYLRRVYEDIIYRDLIVRFKIRDTKSFRELSRYLFTNITSVIGYNSLQRVLNIGSVWSVKNYIDYLRQSFLFTEVFKYDYSMKKQLVYDKKIFSIDNGLRNAVSLRFSNDSGKLLENAVFIHLKRTDNEIYYYKGKRECDFLISYKNKIASAIQVTDLITNSNRDREMEGLREAMQKFDLKEGTIITRDTEDKYDVNEGVIRIVPAYKWLQYEQSDIVNNEKARR